jgi:hypothetical protein
MEDPFAHAQLIANPTSTPLLVPVREERRLLSLGLVFDAEARIGSTTGIVLVQDGFELPLQPKVVVEHPGFEIFVEFSDDAIVLTDIGRHPDGKSQYGTEERGGESDCD